MNKIIVYDRPNFMGLSREFTSDVPDLHHENLNNCISSLKVIGNPWMGYTGTSFQGYQSVYEEGEYAKVEHNNNISSLELVTEDLDDPQITLYAQKNGMGQSLVLNCETNLAHGAFRQKISSYLVERGAWVLYELENRGGHTWLARQGHGEPPVIVKYRPMYMSSYTSTFESSVSHARPLRAGKPTIKAEVEWDKKKESVNTVILDSITGVNHASETQTFTTELSQEYSRSNTESFSFNNSTQLAYGIKFHLTLFGATAENTLNVNNTFTVEKGSSNTRTTTETIRVSMPMTIPPRTKLTANILRKEKAVTVPVKLAITTGFHSKVEYGEYRCVQGNCVTTEFKEEKIEQPRPQRDKNFNNCISSLKVIGNPWVVYTEAKFAGEAAAYEEGEYACVEFNKNISSLNLVTEDLENPLITLYEKKNHKGRSHDLRCETNLTYGTFNYNKVFYSVHSGVWALYEQENRSGRVWVVMASHEDKNLFKPLRHVRPLKAGKPTIEAEVEWHEKTEKLKMFIIDSIIGVNHRSETQTLTTELTREYSGFNSENFDFKDSTKIKDGIKFDLTLFGATVKNTLNVRNTFTVEKGSSNTRTTTETIKLSMPISIPPHTKVTVNVVRKEVAVTVPVKLIITTRFCTAVEYGEYRCEHGNCFIAEFREEKIEQPSAD